MNRKELYATIVKMGLQNEVKTKYGVNYTNCRNEELLKIIEKANKSKVSKKVPLPKSVVAATSLENNFKRLVNILKERHLLLDSDVEKIFND